MTSLEDRHQIARLTRERDEALAAVERVRALERNWARLAGEAMDPDTREWLVAVVRSVHAALTPPTGERP